MHLACPFTLQKLQLIRRHTIGSGNTIHRPGCERAPETPERLRDTDDKVGSAVLEAEPCLGDGSLLVWAMVQNKKGLRVCVSKWASLTFAGRAAEHHLRKAFSLGTVCHKITADESLLGFC